MLEKRRFRLRLPRHARAAVVLFGCLLFTACKTSEDAKAAASQLTATGKSLSDYYSALNTILVETDQLNAVQEVLYGIPYDPQAKRLIADTKAEMQKREALAKELTELAQSFAKLTGSASSADAAAAASKLATEVESLTPTTSEMGSTEQNAMKAAVGLVVTGIKEHKEREAAQGISQFTKALHDFFAKEEPNYESINKDYVSISSSLAKSLLQKEQTDPSSFFKVALDPYGLTPQVTDAKLRDGIEKLAEAGVDQKAKAMNDAETSATSDMDKSLKKMAERIDLVANEKPMEIRIPPITVANVEKWASQFETTTP